MLEPAAFKRSRNPLSHLAYWSASFGLWIEHGPTATRSRESVPWMISLMVFRPSRTVCQHALVIVKSAFNCAGDGSEVIRLMLTLCVLEICLCNPLYIVFAPGLVLHRKYTDTKQDWRGKPEKSLSNVKDQFFLQNFFCLDAIRGVSEACDQNVCIYIAGANERNNEGVRQTGKF